MGYDDNAEKQKQVEADARRPIIFKLNGHTWGAVNLLATFGVFLALLNWKWEVDRNFEELKAGMQYRWTSVHEQRAWSEFDHNNPGFTVPDVSQILRELPPAAILGSGVRVPKRAKWENFE